MLSYYARYNDKKKQFMSREQPIDHERRQIQGEGGKGIQYAETKYDNLQQAQPSSLYRLVPYAAH